MKRNMLTVVILALVVVNIVLTGLMYFSIMPTTKKQNELITKVAGAIDLQLQDQNEGGDTTIPIDQIQVYDIADSLTINLKKGDDGEDHFAVVSVSLSLNTKDKDFGTYSAELSAKESLVKDRIINVVSNYSIDDLKGNTTEVQDELLAELQKMFDSKFIVGVGFRDVIYQ